ncbi:MAG: tRNA 2-selenouridine(34) synthase MnmH [Fluviicoccus sp.]|uniref:tRNA 2-selenouridine(34) synthase MnmH n=1 Tax=Fluviicoccus sp. TaxID=2003552 RepID=UPI0027193CD5|nr:tRNA 2-selenouridine(34) synthase MnmH [Fluviicoccus sp.]MDO8329847.1 tRNA 2-selenouridine(34) synthase MnmH [Fluviicoccus sp.]
MSPPGMPFAATLAQRLEFDEVIDVRSPAEYADDHLPGAINCPVLDDAERARVGTIYKQVSPFEARKVGGALVSRNIARHLEERFHDRPKSWRPLVYCWRGGQRSGAMTLVLQQVGWAARRLEGGYKAYRREVVRLLETPPDLRLRLLCGPTGSGKTALLHAIAAQGGQVLDLEGLARHKGSALGVLPGEAQPSQKAFESALAAKLASFDAARPVYAESESKTVGSLRLPPVLFQAMGAAERLWLDAPFEARVDFLLRDYDYFLQAPEWLGQRLDRLVELHGKETVARWRALAAAGEWRELVAGLLREHYDPAYHKASRREFARLQDAPRLELAAIVPACLEERAAQLLS